VSDGIIETDYLIVGAGATGMAFADSLLHETQATMVMADRRHRPGGHWNDAYPFVRLHQPAATYGLPSRPLGSGQKDRVGLNAGLYELASGQEVLSHFDLAMQQQFLPSGRVQFFPMSEVGEDGVITSLLSGERQIVRAKKVVDATYSQMQIPATHPPTYEVADAVACVPPNDLPRVAQRHSAYVVVGAGKTAMDTCVWLLTNGADPDSIRWIMPRDSWVVNRACLQTGEEFFPRLAESIANQTEALATGRSLDDVFLHLEVMGEVMRIDPTVKPEAYHCALLSEGEIEQLRRIRNIVRLGRVQRISVDQVTLADGAIPMGANTLIIDCSAAGTPTRPTVPVFAGDRITLQWVRFCQPTFSASAIAHVEATYIDEVEKNLICAPIAPPTVPKDWVRMMAVEFQTRQVWAEHPDMVSWQATTRLDPFTSHVRSPTAATPEVAAHLQRYAANTGQAVERIQHLLAQ
jgi:hypothetical protein